MIPCKLAAGTIVSSPLRGEDKGEGEVIKRFIDISEAYGEVVHCSCTHYYRKVAGKKEIVPVFWLVPGDWIY